jgi:hypothetical protein
VDNNLGFEKEPAIKEAYLKGEIKHEKDRPAVQLNKSHRKGLER